MSKRLFIDIETLPPPEEMRASLNPALVSKLESRHRETRCDADDAECTEEQFRRLALHAEYGRVLTVGMIVEHEGKVVCRGVLGRERESMRFHLDEAKTLRGFWKQLREFDDRKDLIIGHNIFDFDLLFLYKRSIIHRVQPSVRLSFARYRSRPIFDTMKEWELWAWRPGIKLDELAEVLHLGMTKTEGMDGGSVYDRYREGSHQEIADYCMQDVELTREIYYRLTFEGKAGKAGAAGQ
jgi:DNA polymerase elongation subunit (family B)